MEIKMLKDLLFAVIPVALKAGQNIMEIYGRKFQVDFKVDNSPLTEADRLSHEVINEGISLMRMRFPVLSEEGKNIPFSERRDWEYFWLVDPLDGTKEFVKRNGEFTVNIALIHKQSPVLGVIYAPAKDILYYAAEGIGSYKLEKASKVINLKDIFDRSVELPVSRCGNSPFTIVGSRSHHSENMDRFVEEMKFKYGDVVLMSAGSSLKFCLVAEGTADVYPRFGPTMEWDTAAGQAIMEQAGGEVLCMGTNRPMKYNRDNLLNSFFFARAKMTTLV